jgi:hypothetical protein
MIEAQKTAEAAVTPYWENIADFTVSDLLVAIGTPPPEREGNDSYPSTVYRPLETAKACTFIPD